MLDSEFQHNFHTHTFRCKHAKGDVVARTQDMEEYSNSLTPREAAIS